MADSLRLDGAALKLVDCSEVNVNKVVSGANCESIDGNDQECSGRNEPDPAVDTQLSDTIMPDGVVTNSVAVPVPVPMPALTDIAMGQSTLSLPISSSPSSNLSSSKSLLTSPTTVTMTTPSTTGPVVAAMVTNDTMVPATVTVSPIVQSMEHESTKIVNTTAIAATPVPANVAGDLKIIDNAGERHSVSVQHVGLTTMNAKALLPPPPPIPAMDLQDIEDLRKKRCADRYDSSESSDR